MEEDVIQAYITESRTAKEQLAKEQKALLSMLTGMLVENSDQDPDVQDVEYVTRKLAMVKDKVRRIS